MSINFASKNAFDAEASYMLDIFLRKKYCHLKNLDYDHTGYATI
jgi:hypothetical protein